MVRSGPVVAAAVAMLEQQTTAPSAATSGLRRVGAVSVLPRRSASASNTDSDQDDSSEEPPPTVKTANTDSVDPSTTQEAPAWTDSAHSGTSDEITSASASDTDDNNRDEPHTTGCDDDFQWVQNCGDKLRPQTPPETTDMRDKFNELYSNNGQDPGKPVTYRSKPANRKERDTKSKSSSVYNRYQSPYAEDILRGSGGCRNLCYNCSTSCQELPLPDFPHHKEPISHRYGSSPGLDYHWPLTGYYPCHHRIPYYCDQIYPQYRYFKSSSDSEELVRRLEADKERLSLQVSVLNEQIDAQSEKISDLEKSLEEKKKQIHTAENVLSQEMLTRSSLETQKLELLALVSELKRQHVALERENCELRDRLADERRRNKPPIIPRNSPYPAASTPNQIASRGASPSPSPVTNNITSPRKVTEHHDDINVQNQSPSGYKRVGDLQYSSLPRQVTSTVDTPRARVAFGRSLMLMRAAGDRSSSVPNLADTDTVVISDTMSESDGRSNTPQPYPSPSLQTNKNKGIKKIFGKMRRSGSGNLDDLPGDSEFRRGGIRATAGGRLGWSSPPLTRPQQPLREWSCEQVCEWLTGMGLECAAEARRWGKTGAQLLAATQHEIDKELAIKNPLHRKKLHLALHCERGSSGDPTMVPAGALDTAWVLRWLDDAGLPQHKEAFMAARVDGRLLHRLTLDDLATMHVTSVLHVASIRTGIQVLRSQNFEANCLVRRSSGEGGEGEPQGGEGEVALWTNHRVMEWLRAVDLAEYAPNLRGSGVHGGLMVYEPRFTGELLASLLSIPPAKTLLRRHLLTHFKDLLGREVIQLKREAEASLGYVPLTATAKMKVPKKSQFTLKRKKPKSELDYGELVCPLSQSRADDTSGDSSSPSPGKTPSHGAVSHEGEVNGVFLPKNGIQELERNTSV